MYVRCIYIVILIQVAIVTRSQTQDHRRIDSLKACLYGKEENARINILYELSASLIDVDNRAALKFSLEGMNIAAVISDSLQFVRTGLVAGSALWRLQKLDSSLLVYTL